MMPHNLQIYAEGEDGQDAGQGSQDQQGAQSAAGTEDNQNTNQGTNQSSTDKQKDEKTFTQHQVSAMMAKEKKQGKAAAYAESI